MTLKVFINPEVGLLGVPQIFSINVGVVTNMLFRSLTVSFVSLFIFIFSAPLAVSAQSLIQDLNTASTRLSNIQILIRDQAEDCLGGKLVFVASDPVTGTGLYATGTSGAAEPELLTTLPSFVTSLGYGDGDSYSTVLAGRVWFYMSLGSSTELWSSDGTAAGTQKLATLPDYADIEILGVNGSIVYYTYQDYSSEEFRLFKSNGTTAGTSLVHSFGAGWTKIGFNSPANPIRIGNSLYLSLRNYNTRRSQEYRFDFATETVSAIGTDFDTQYPAELNPMGDSVFGKFLLYFNDANVGEEVKLYKVNTSTQSLDLIKNITYTPAGGYIYDFDVDVLFTTSSQIYFVFSEYYSTAEFYVTDGTTAGTVPATLPSGVNANNLELIGEAGGYAFLSEYGSPSVKIHRVNLTTNVWQEVTFAGVGNFDFSSRIGIINDILVVRIYDNDDNTDKMLAMSGTTSEVLDTGVSSASSGLGAFSPSLAKINNGVEDLFIYRGGLFPNRKVMRTNGTSAGTQELLDIGTSFSSEFFGHGTTATFLFGGTFYTTNGTPGGTSALPVTLGFNDGLVMGGEEPLGCGNTIFHQLDNYVAGDRASSQVMALSQGGGLEVNAFNVTLDPVMYSASSEPRDMISTQGGVFFAASGDSSTGGNWSGRGTYFYDQTTGSIQRISTDSNLAILGSIGTKAIYADFVNSDFIDDFRYATYNLLYSDGVSGTMQVFGSLVNRGQLDYHFTDSRFFFVSADNTRGFLVMSSDGMSAPVEHLVIPFGSEPSDYDDYSASAPSIAYVSEKLFVAYRGVIYVLNPSTGAVEFQITGLFKNISSETSCENGQGIFLTESLVAGQSFGSNNEVWRTDGTQVGTTKLSPADTDGDFEIAGCINNKAVFGDNNGALYSYDVASGTGSPIETGIDFLSENPRFYDYRPQRFNSVKIGNRLFFAANLSDFLQGTQLYESDGTASGTGRVTDALVIGGSLFPEGFRILGSEIYFMGRDYSSSQFGEDALYKTDGSGAGTQRIIKVRNWYQALTQMVILGNQVIFSGYAPSTGVEPFEYTSGSVADNCPADPAKLEPGACGCGVPDTDNDSDGTPNCLDPCLDDPAKILPGECGCGIPEGSCSGPAPTPTPTPDPVGPTASDIIAEQLATISANVKAAGKKTPKKPNVKGLAKKAKKKKLKKWKNKKKKITDAQQAIKDAFPVLYGYSGSPEIVSVQSSLTPENLENLKKAYDKAAGKRGKKATKFWKQFAKAFNRL